MNLIEQAAASQARIDDRDRKNTMNQTINIRPITYGSHNKTHYLKTWSEFYRDVYSGIKTFEIRRNDRDFQTGDLLVLEEWDKECEEYTGYAVSRRVIHIIFGPKFGLAEGFCIMSLGDPAKP